MISKSWKALCAAAALGLAAGGAFAQDKVPVRISFNQADTSPAWREVIKVFGDELEAKSNGRFQVTHYPGEVLHTVGDGFRAVATGITDISSAWPVYSVNSFNIVQGMDLPFAMPVSNVAAVRISDELYNDFLKAEYERMGILLAYNSTTPQMDILTTKPVRSLDDLRGLKIRAAGGTISKVIELLGAVPVTMTITDSYAAFQQGVVDGIVLSTADMVAYRMHEVGKYNYRIGISRVYIPSAVNKGFYNGLPDDLKTVFDSAATNAGYNYQQMYDRLTERALETMGTEGVEITIASDADRERINALVAPVWDAFVKANEGRPGPAAADFVTRIRELAAKYGEMSDEEILALKDSAPVAGLR